MYCCPLPGAGYCPLKEVTKVVGVPGSEGEDEPPPQAKRVMVVTLNNASRAKYFLKI
jgi:hypothetical protein